MAKKSVWLWVGVAAGAGFLLFGLCVCSIAGYAYFSSQRQAQAKKQVERARPLLSDADAVLKDLETMSTLSPSNTSAANRALSSAADLPIARTKLVEARAYLKEADDAGASGDVADYVEAKLESTYLKLEIVDLCVRQEATLAKATRAAAMARSARALLTKGANTVDKGVPLRNADKFGQSDAVRRKGARMLLQSLELYKKARSLYPSASFSAAVSYIAKMREVERYEATLDSLGKAGRFRQYNRIVPRANSSRKAANKLWSAASTGGKASVIDDAYSKSVRDLVEKISEKTNRAASKDAEAERVWSSLGQ